MLHQHDASAQRKPTKIEGKLPWKEILRMCSVLTRVAGRGDERGIVEQLFSSCPAVRQSLKRFLKVSINVMRADVTMLELLYRNQISILMSQSCIIACLAQEPVLFCLCNAVVSSRCGFRERNCSKLSSVHSLVWIRRR